MRFEVQELRGGGGLRPKNSCSFWLLLAVVWHLARWAKGGTQFVGHRILGHRRAEEMKELQTWAEMFCVSFQSQSNHIDSPRPATSVLCTPGPIPGHPHPWSTCRIVSLCSHEQVPSGTRGRVWTARAQRAHDRKKLGVFATIGNILAYTNHTTPPQRWTA